MYENNNVILQQVIDDGSLIWSSEEQHKVSGSEAVKANHSIWNATINRFQQIKLWENGTPNFKDDVAQPEPNIIFFPCEGKEVRGTILVSHGGAFVMRAGHEGFYTAYKFQKMGYNVAVLTYRLVPYTRGDALDDCLRAIRVLRYKKDELGISDKIAVMGYSAGGMLSGNAATHYDLGDDEAEDPIERMSSRPDGAVLCYGAFAESSYPGGMFVNPFDKQKRDDRVFFAVEKNVDINTPPLFIWQTISDDPRNGMALAKELTDYGVPFELHFFPDGHHGVGLADGYNDENANYPHLAHWSMLAGEWLEMQGLQEE